MVINFINRKYWKKKLKGMINNNEFKDLLIFIGKKHYPTIQSFLDEANQMGISRRLHKLPHGVIAGKSTAYLAHEQKTKCVRCNGSGQLKQAVKTREIPVEYQGDTLIVEEFSIICPDCQGKGHKKNPVIFASYIIPGLRIYINKLPPGITDINSMDAKLYALHRSRYRSDKGFDLNTAKNNKEDRQLIQDLKITAVILNRGKAKPKQEEEHGG